MQYKYFMRHLSLLSLALFLFSCSLVRNVERSTQAISENREAVIESTAGITSNHQEIEQSTIVIKNNKNTVRDSTKVIADNGEMIRQTTDVIRKNRDIIASSTSAIHANQEAVLASTQAIQKNAQAVLSSTAMIEQLKPDKITLLIIGAIFLFLLVLPSVLAASTGRRVEKRLNASLEKKISQAIEDSKKTQPKT